MSKRTRQPHWQDNTAVTRQRKRRQRLNEIAQSVGYDTWTKLETAVINGDISQETTIIQLTVNKPE